MTYEFKTAKVGEVFYVKFIKADGNIRRMCAEFVEKRGDLINVIDLDLDQPRSFIASRVISVAKITKRNDVPVVAKEAQQIARPAEEYVVTAVDKRWNIFHNGVLIGTAYKQEQVGRMIDYHRNWVK